MEYSRHSKIEELESIRGLAALFIVVFHLPKWNPFLNLGLINNGYLMVDLFFVLSGFVIFNAYGNRIDSRNDLLRFQWLRLGRLYPVHITFLLVFLVIEFAKYTASTKYGISNPNSAPFDRNNLSAFLKNVFLISSVLPYQGYTFNHPAWSISVEFYTYLVFGVIILLFRRSSGWLFSAIALASIAMLVTKNVFGFAALLRCFAGFFLGCMAAKLAMGTKISLPSHYSILILGAMALFLQFKIRGGYDPVIYLLTAALIVCLVLSPDGRLNRLLRLRPLVWLGTISYSIYMSHAAVIWVTNQIFRVALKKPGIVGADGKVTPQLTQAETVLACAATILVVLMVSTLVYYLIEMPMREKSRRVALAPANGSN